MTNKKATEPVFGLRFNPVVIGRYIGDYTGRFTCWSIADRDSANRTNGEKFDTYEQAKARADELNTACLPGLEAVRELENPTPTFDAPFSLESEPVTVHGIQPGLFEE